MSKFKDTVITVQGNSAIEEAVTLGASMKFTSAVTTTDDLTGLTNDQIAAMTKFSEVSQTADVTISKDDTSGQVTVSTTILNTDVKEDYKCLAIGWQATDSFGNSILFAITPFSGAELIPAPGGSIGNMSLTATVVFKVDNAESVTVVSTTDGLATKADLIEASRQAKTDNQTILNQADAYADSNLAKANTYADASVKKAQQDDVKDTHNGMIVVNGKNITPVIDNGDQSMRLSGENVTPADVKETKNGMYFGPIGSFDEIEHAGYYDYLGTVSPYFPKSSTLLIHQFEGGNTLVQRATDANTGVTIQRSRPNYVGGTFTDWVKVMSSEDAVADNHDGSVTVNGKTYQPVNNSDTNNWQKQQIFPAGDFKLKTFDNTDEFVKYIADSSFIPGISTMRVNAVTSIDGTNLGVLDCAVLREDIGWFYATGISSEGIPVTGIYNGTSKSWSGWKVTPQSDGLGNLGNTQVGGFGQVHDIYLSKFGLWTADLVASLQAKELPTGADFNDYQSDGFYAFGLSHSANFKNSPLQYQTHEYYGYLKVKNIADVIFQDLYSNYGYHFKRYADGADHTFGPWVGVDGTLIMTGAQNVHDDFNNYTHPGTYFFETGDMDNSPFPGRCGALRVSQQGNFMLQEFISDREAEAARRTYSYDHWYPWKTY